MLIRVKVKDVRVGVHVERVVGSWIDHPFWRSSFLIKDQATLLRLTESRIEEVWIDVVQGIDPREGLTDTPPPETPQSATGQPATSQPGAGPVPVSSRPGRKPAQVSLADEAERAQLLREKGRQVVERIMKDARMGHMHADEGTALVGDIYESIQRNHDAFVSVARIKAAADYTYLHSVSVCALMILLAQQLSMSRDQICAAGLAGLLHDVGKAAIPLNLLHKPSALSEAEFAVVRGHPAAGAAILRQSGTLAPEVIDVCLHHHERIDGKGYPDRLSDEQISVFAKMGAVCDVYDAITSDRPYKRAFSAAEAMRRMAAETASHFDESIFKSFVKCVGLYPVGSVVRLASDRLAVVLQQNEDELLYPLVRMFYSINAKCRIMPELVDLTKSRDRIVSHEDPLKWGLTHTERLWREF